MKIRYIIINETAEFSKHEFKEYGNAADALTASGMQNGSFTQIGEFETFEAAKAELAKYHTEYGLMSGYAGVKFYAADIYYIEEQKYNEEWDEWESTGDYEFAEETEI